MEPIYPLTEEHLGQFCGQLVCVVLQDGTRHVGVLSRCSKGRLLLNDEWPEQDGVLGLSQAAAKGKGKRRLAGKPAATSKRRGKPAAAPHAPDVFTAAFPFAGGYPYAPYRPRFYGPRLWLDLALIALVLLIL